MGNRNEDELIDKSDDRSQADDEALNFRILYLYVLNALIMYLGGKNAVKNITFS